ncbi:hypothetical protein FI667_g6958, partial [Globisporangium splendens]
MLAKKDQALKMDSLHKAKCEFRLSAWQNGKRSAEGERVESAPVGSEIVASRVAGLKLFNNHLAQGNAAHVNVTVDDADQKQSDMDTDTGDAEKSDTNVQEDASEEKCNNGRNEKQLHRNVKRQKHKKYVLIGKIDSTLRGLTSSPNQVFGGFHLLFSNRPSLCSAIALTLFLVPLPPICLFAPPPAPSAMHAAIARLSLCHQLKRSAVASLTGRSAAAVRCFSDVSNVSNDSTTYSGGHPNVGQGGFYGSIKSRSDLAAEFIPGSRVEAEDLGQLVQIMEKWDALANAAKDEEDKHAAWEQLTGEQANVELIKRLIVKGGPAWGLSQPQREFVSRFLR